MDVKGLGTTNKASDPAANGAPGLAAEFDVPSILQYQVEERPSTRSFS